VGLEEGIESIANKVKPSITDKKLDQVSLRILALTFNMAGGLPDNEQQIDQILQKDNVYHDVYVFSS
jgi:hypothetical protein